MSFFSISASLSEMFQLPASFMMLFFFRSRDNASLIETCFLKVICKFIPYSKLKKKFEEIRDDLEYVKPEVIEKIAESCEYGI